MRSPRSAPMARASRSTISARAIRTSRGCAQLPVDRVKLDRSLIEHVAEQPEARTIAQAVIGLIHGLGCEAVAEGIESEAQAACCA